MRFRHHVPPPPLGAFVELVWLFEGAPEPWAQERLLPQGTVELVIDLGGGRWSGSVSGPHSQSFVIDTSRPRRLVGVHFRPGGAFPFVEPPMHELHNAIVSLDDLWGATARALQARLGETRSDDELFETVDRVLLSRAGDRLRCHPAVAYALREFMRVPHVRTVAEVSGSVGLSHRRFIERFAGEVGMTPKTFCRVRRFQAAVEQAHRRARPDWASLALDCGYYDQAHFIHDFQAFSGLTPAQWAARRTPHVNHVPIRD